MIEETVLKDAKNRMTYRKVMEYNELTGERTLISEEYFPKKKAGRKK